jgi:outer membrane protein assembly factor BamB
MRFRLRQVVLLLVAPFLCAQADDWPQLQQNAARTGRTGDSVPPPYRTRWFWAGTNLTLQNSESAITNRTRSDALVAAWSNTYASYPLPAQATFTISGLVQPVVADGHVHVGTMEGEAYAIETHGGRTAWSASIPGGTFVSPAVASGVVVYAGVTGAVYGLDAATGARRWSLPTRRALTVAPCAEGGRVFAADHGGWVYGIGVTNGRPLWRTRLPAPVLGGIAAQSNRVFVGAENMVLYALDAASGAVQTQCQVRGQSFRMLWPVVWSNFVFAHSVTTPRTGSEDLLDGTILSASPNVYTPANLAIEETNILKYLTGDTNAFADASVDWQRVFAIRLPDFTMPFVVRALPADGCGTPAAPVVVDRHGRVLTYFPSKYGTLTPRAGWGTTNYIDISAINLQNGRRQLIDNGAIANVWTWEADNLYAMTVAGDWLWLRQDFRGTHAVNLTNSAVRDVQAEVRNRDGGFFLWDCVYTAVDPQPLGAQTPILGRTSPAISGNLVFIAENYGIVAIEHGP